MSKAILSGETTSWSFAEMETFLKAHRPDLQHLAHEYVFNLEARFCWDGHLVTDGILMQ